jgi:hypothetical protein
VVDFRDSEANAIDGRDELRSGPQGYEKIIANAQAAAGFA